MSPTAKHSERENDKKGDKKRKRSISCSKSPKSPKFSKSPPGRSTLGKFRDQFFAKGATSTGGPSLQGMLFQSRGRTPSPAPRHRIREQPASSIERRRRRTATQESSSPTEVRSRKRCESGETTSRDDAPVEEALKNLDLDESYEYISPEMPESRSRVIILPPPPSRGSSPALGSADKAQDESTPEEPAEAAVTDGEGEDRDKKE